MPSDDPEKRRQRLGTGTMRGNNSRNKRRTQAMTTEIKQIVAVEHPRATRRRARGCLFAQLGKLMGSVGCGS